MITSTIDAGGEIIIAVDVAGPGRDRTVCTAISGAAILETGVFSDADARGPVLAFIRKYENRLRLVNVDSSGIGFYFCEHIRTAGYRTVGINVGSASSEPERFRNLKAQRYWHLRERFARGEVSGLSDEALSELASVNYVIDPSGKTAIEDKASAKSTLGRSPDIAESLMLALGEGPPQPYEYIPVGSRDTSGKVNPYPLIPAYSDRESSQAKGEAVAACEDMVGGSRGWMHTRLRFGRVTW